LKVDKALVASVGLHVLVIGWGLISFSSRAFESAEESVPIEFVTSDQLSRMTQGTKSGAKENPKPLVEKVADARPVDDNIGKITEKQPIVTDAGPDPTPVEKPVEKKPDPPKPVAESKPKDEPKPIEKKPDPPKVDPIAEALKKEEAKKPAPKPQQAKAAPPPPVKKHEYKFSVESTAALLDKREPTRQAYAGETQNSSASLGALHGTAASLSQSEMGAMRALLKRLWTIQGDETAEELTLTVRISLNPDRRLAALPQVVSGGNTPRAKAAAESAVRAIMQGQPFSMLRDETYQQWKYMDIDFGPEM
jgi:outer membrane biosynthesis protein TonB